MGEQPEGVGAAVRFKHSTALEKGTENQEPDAENDRRRMVAAGCDKYQEGGWTTGKTSLPDA